MDGGEASTVNKYPRNVKTHVSHIRPNGSIRYFEASSSV